MPKGTPDDLATALRNETDLLTRCATRLDELATQNTTAPTWLSKTMTDLATRCRQGRSDIESAIQNLTPRP